MKRFKVKVNCRKVGAIGIFYPVVFSDIQADSDSRADIMEALHEQKGREWEHFSILEVTPADQPEE